MIKELGAKLPQCDVNIYRTQQANLVCARLSDQIRVSIWHILDVLVNFSVVESFLADEYED
jgi:hypothetical protein